MSYDASEQGLVLEVFNAMLRAATGDGGKKRAAGLKPPWWRDPAHEAAIFSHLDKWKHGERQDKDSGAHPLVHLAWRALAIAYQETYGLVDPDPGRMPGVPEEPAPGTSRVTSRGICVSPYCSRFGLPVDEEGVCSGVSTGLTLDVGDGPKPMAEPDVVLEPMREWPGGAAVPGHPDYLGDVLIGSRTGGMKDWPGGANMPGHPDYLGDLRK